MTTLNGLDKCLVSQSRRHRQASAKVASMWIMLVAVISFLPPREKDLLHTKGPWHLPGHLVAFALISLFLLMSVRSGRNRYLILLVTIGFGWSLEVIQHLVYRHHLEWRDLLADTIGVIAGLALLRIYEFTLASGHGGDP